MARWEIIPQTIGFSRAGYGNAVHALACCVYCNGGNLTFVARNVARHSLNILNVVKYPYFQISNSNHIAWRVAYSDIVHHQMSAFCSVLDERNIVCYCIDQNLYEGSSLSLSHTHTYTSILTSVSSLCFDPHHCKPIRCLWLFL